MTRTITVADLYPAGTVWIRETGLRDGLQLVKSWPSTDAKRRWIEIDHAAGVRHFEAGSYLPADKFPQFADVDAVIDIVNSLGGLSSALALNFKGAQHALAGQAHEITCVVSASEEHNLRNARLSRAQGLSQIGDVLSLRADSDRRPVVSVGIAMAFGCSIAGYDAVCPAEVARMAEQVVREGADVLGIADTVGYAGPAQIRTVIRALRSAVGDTPLMMHLHDTRGLGLANAAAALDEGITLFDASLAGLGGCPFAPNATGNVVLEDLVFLCRSMGYPTPIDPERLLPARDVLAEAMPHEELHGQFAKAGLPLCFRE